MPHCRPVKELGLQCEGLRVRVSSDEAGHLAWLREFVCPQFQEVPADACEARVVLNADTARYEALSAAGPRAGADPLDVFGLDTTVVRLPLWNGAAGETTVFEEATGVFYARADGGREVSLVTRPGNPLARFQLMRVVRELAVERTRLAGGLVLHAAALEWEGRGVAIAGQKAAGKTTLLLGLLRQPRARYLANDRVALIPGVAGPALLGLPTLVLLRAGTLELFPDLRSKLAAHGSRPDPAGRHALLPAAFCELLDVAPAGRSGAWAVVFPRQAPEVAGLEARRLETPEAAPLLHAARFGAGREKRRPQLLGASSPGAPPELGGLCAELAARLRCFECRLGRDAPARPALMAALLERLAAD